MLLVQYGVVGYGAKSVVGYGVIGGVLLVNVQLVKCWCNWCCVVVWCWYVVTYCRSQCCW